MVMSLKNIQPILKIVLAHVEVFFYINLVIDLEMP